MLSNIKNSQKTIYQSNLEQYLESGLNLISKHAKGNDKSSSKK